MFGHHDDDENNQNEQVDQSQPATTPIGQALAQQNDSDTGVDQTGPINSDQNWQFPTLPGNDDQPNQAEPIMDVVSPAGGYPKSPSFKDDPDTPVPVPTPMPIPTPAPDPNSSNDSQLDASNKSSDDLLVIKHRALNDLEPLLDHLDQTSEERFKTLMMLIQASDDEDLVESAYKAAHGIEDEKVKAQALLDVINEINYFTQLSDQTKADQ